jgi:O-acetylhomoserine/O-acetylserine sulfhydrylase-like pyridoxal-dependent enzyme
MTQPSPGYHGVIFHETFGDFGFSMRARMETLRVYGAALSAMSAWQILQGVGDAAAAHGAALQQRARRWPSSCAAIRA